MRICQRCAYFKFIPSTQTHILIPFEDGHKLTGLKVDIAFSSPPDTHIGTIVHIPPPTHSPKTHVHIHTEATLFTPPPPPPTPPAQHTCTQRQCCSHPLPPPLNTHIIFKSINQSINVFLYVCSQQDGITHTHTNNNNNKNHTHHIPRPQNIKVSEEWVLAHVTHKGQ